MGSAERRRPGRDTDVKQQREIVDAPVGAEAGMAAEKEGLGEYMDQVISVITNDGRNIVVRPSPRPLAPATAAPLTRRPPPRPPNARRAS